VKLLQSRIFRNLRWPLLLTAAVLLSAAEPRGSLIVLGADRIPPSVTLVRPVAYTLLAPVSDVLDVISLMSVRQHYSFVAFVLITYIFWRATRLARRPRRILKETAAAGLLAGGIAGLYVAAALLPRPVAGLRIGDPDLLAIDFHSHTNASYDARKSFGVESNRAWHRDGGFNAAFVTDHRSYKGSDAAQRHNSLRSGSNTVLLPGLEIADEEERVIALGLNPARTDILVGDWDGKRETELETRDLAAADSPAVLVLTLPANLKKIPADELSGAAPLVAIEIADASPRGLEQERLDRARILRLADSLNLALVSGSDNHGWGETVSAWTLMRISGWRAMSPSVLDLAIRKKLATERRSATIVVARRDFVVSNNSPAAADLWPTFLWEASSLTFGERISWLAWSWGFYALLLLAKRRRLRPTKVIGLA
jgi:hypothetical protein